MKTHRDEIDRPFAAKLIGAQALVTALFSAFCCLISINAGVSALIGGSIAVGANFYLVRKVLKPVKGDLPEVVLVSLYASEIIKLTMIAVLFFVAFKWVAALQEPKNVFLMLLCFLVVQGAHIFAPLFLKKKQID